MLGIWEHRNVTIQLFEDQNGAPYALLKDGNGSRRMPSEQIYFGLNSNIQGPELVAIIKEIGQSLANGSLSDDRACRVVLHENYLHFLLPLFGAGVNFSKCKKSKKSAKPPHKGVFIQPKDNMALWPRPNQNKTPSNLHNCCNTLEIASLWLNANEDQKKSCEKLAHKIIQEYQKNVAKQKDHILEVLPLTLINNEGVSLALMQSLNNDLSDGKMDNPFVTIALAYFIRLAPKEFLMNQTHNLKTILLNLKDKTQKLMPPDRSFVSKMIKPEIALPDPMNLLAAVEALCQIIEALADANLYVLEQNEKNLIHSIFDDLQDHPDFRVKIKATYAKQALLRVPEVEPREYLLLCSAGSTIMLIGQLAVGVRV